MHHTPSIFCVACQGARLKQRIHICRQHEIVSAFFILLNLYFLHQEELLIFKKQLISNFLFFFKLLYYSRIIQRKVTGLYGFPILLTWVWLPNCMQIRMKCCIMGTQMDVQARTFNTSLILPSQSANLTGYGCTYLG